MDEKIELTKNDLLKRGFIKTGLSPTCVNVDTGEKQKGGLHFSKNGKAFLTVELNENELYDIKEIYFFYESLIPEEYTDEIEIAYTKGTIILSDESIKDAEERIFENFLRFIKGEPMLERN